MMGSASLVQNVTNRKRTNLRKVSNTKAQGLPKLVEANVAFTLT